MAPTDTGEYIPLETLNANGEDNHNEVEGEQPHRKRTNIWHRLGTTSVLIVSLGCPLILLAVTLLALFWYYSMRAMDGQEPEIYWVRIIYANWATRLVTVCTTVIRTVVASQVGLTTAMVASIVLETTGVPFLLGPFYSMLRAFKVAPINLWTATNFQPYMSRFIYALMLTEVLVTVTSQFLSTIFLSDFGNAAFTQRSKKTNIKLLETEGFVNNVWWFVPPAASWTFAELSESFETRPGFHDTGHTFRAFLPFEEEAQRSKLRRFKGPVPIMNHRVVCASPSLINLSLDTTWQSYVTLSGQIPTKDLTYPLLIDPASQRFINFSCKLPTVSLARNNTVGETSICAPHSLSEWAFLDQEPLDKAFAKGMELFIILDIVSALALWEITGNITTVQTIRTDGPWTITSNGSAHIETVRVSACLTSLATQTFTVEMNSTSDNLEPKATWNHRTKRYNTEHSRLQLGVSSPGNTSSANHRGILTLGPRSQWEIIQPPASPYFFSAIMLGFPSLTRYGLGTRRIDPVVTLSSRSSHFYDGGAHPIHTDLFQDTLISTASPALALQVVLTRVYQMAYYEHLVKSNTQVASTSAFSVATTIPVQWTGFVLGTVLIAIHLIIVISVLGWFVKSTEISFIGCYWQTVAQLVSSETRPVLEEADRMNDRAVGEWMKREAALGSDRWVLRGRTDGYPTQLLKKTFQKGASQVFKLHRFTGFSVPYIDVLRSMATGYSDLEVYHGTAASGPIPVQEEKIFTQITTERQTSSNPNDSNPPSRRARNSLCGIRFTRTRAILLAFLLFVLLAAVAAGLAAGLVVARSSNSRESSSSGNAMSSSSSGVPSSASSATPTSSTRAPTTLVTSTEVVSPTQTLYRDCPSSDNTIYDGKGSNLYQFRKLCARSYKQLPVNLVNQRVASLNDCIDICAEYNILNKTAIASGQSNPCNAVCWRNSATDPDWPGQCFGSTIFNSTEGFQTRDEIICDSAAWINQNI